MRRLSTLLLALPFLGLSALPASAQGVASGGGPLEVHGFGLFGNITFTASESFDAVLGSASGPILGGGGRLTLPLGVYVEVAGYQFMEEGQRVFVTPGREVFPLGIPTTVTVTPVEITGGWRFRNLLPRVVPYAGGGWSSYGYKETSDFATSGEDVNDRFSGYHVVGGADISILSWLNIGGEVAWSSVPDALGEAGASAVFGEDNLGGTSIRLKILVGR